MKHLEEIKQVRGLVCDGGELPAFSIHLLKVYLFDCFDYFPTREHGRSKIWVDYFILQT